MERHYIYLEFNGFRESSFGCGDSGKLQRTLDLNG